jgi:hypothetical protein
MTTTLVRVWNDNVFPFRQVFKGNEIYIGAKKFIEMEETEAYEFRGAYSPIVRDGDGQPTPESYKMIRVEKTDKSAHKPAPAAQEHICQACGKQFGNKKELETHIDSEHIEQLADKEEADKRRSKKNGADKT